MNSVELPGAVHQTVVLEGCDGVGKTTLASQLAQQHGFTIVHGDTTPDGADIIARYVAILEMPGRIVLDRCFISELVYGPLLRGNSRLSVGQVQGLASQVQDRRGIILHLTAPAAEIQARLIARGACPIPTRSEVSEILRRYDEVFAELAQRVMVLRIDTTRLPRDPTG